MKHLRQSVLTVAFPLCLCLLATGCVTANYASIEENQEAKAFTPAPDYASVYIFRESRVWGGGATFPIVVDGRPIGEITSGSFFVLQMVPGEHDVWATPNKNAAAFEFERENVVLTIDVRGGQLRFIEFTFGHAGTPRLTEVDPSRGKEVIIDSRLINAQEVSGPDID